MHVKHVWQRGVLVLMLVAASFMTVPLGAGATVDFSPVAGNHWMTNGVGEVRALLRVGDILYVGGDFTGLENAVTGEEFDQGYLAAFNASTGTLIRSFRPNLDNAVRALAASPDGTVLYAGGMFARVDGEVQRKLAGLDPATGAGLSTFAPNVLGGGVDALVIMPDGDLVAGGVFDTVDGVTRIGLARFGQDGTLRSWNPAANSGNVYGFFIDAPRNRLIVSGKFANINGVSNTRNLAAFSLTTGQLDTGLRVHTPYVTREIEVVGDRLYAAVGGPGGSARVYNVNTGSLLASYSADGDVHSVTVVDDIAYFGGHWITMPGSPTGRFQGVRMSDLSLYHGFQPVIEGTVWEIEYDGEHMYVGGTIVGSAPVSRQGFIAYEEGEWSDTEGPTVPGNLRATEIRDKMVRLAWDASTDASGVAEYEVSLEGEVLKTTTGTSVTDWGLQRETTYHYEVVAIDVLGNRSGPATLEVTTAGKPVTLVGKGTTWRYMDDGSDLGTSWRDIDYSHYLWSKGPAELGYGDGDEATVIDSGPAGNHHITTYFRKKLTASDLSGFTSIEVRLWRDDGAVVYINDVEVIRDNMPAGPIGYTTLASSSVEGDAESNYVSFLLPIDVLAEATNIIAVEIHQVSGSSPDVTMAMTVSGHKWWLEP